jgi:hypothetical protein
LILLSGTVTVDDNLAISGNNTLSFNSNSLNINHSGGSANIFNGAGDLIILGVLMGIRVFV